jgi:hypothetical protein
MPKLPRLEINVLDLGFVQDAMLKALDLLVAVEAEPVLVSDEIREAAAVLRDYLEETVR